MSSSPNPPERRAPRTIDHMIAEFKKQKAEFKINHAPIDPMIEAFCMDLNKSPDIVTMFSCEGHKPVPDDPNNPYLFFNVSQEGMMKLWNFVIPNMLMDASAANLFIHIEVYSDEIGTNGIVFRGYYPPEQWEKGKQAFWHIVSKHMLKFF